MDRPVSIEFLRVQYAYYPGTGVILNRRTKGPAIAGQEAGYVRKDGYRVIRMIFEGQRIQIMAHVIAWTMHHGFWPIGDIDHRDTVRTNNSITNLRDSTRSQNLANRKKLGPLPKGVTFDRCHKSKPFRAQIKDGNKNRFLGNFADPKEAHQKYWSEAIKIHGAFARAS